MQMLKTYQGYFNEGQFVPFGVPFETVSIPNNVEVYVVITDNALSETKNTNSQKQKETFERFLAANRAIVDEPFTKEFDANIASGVSIGRELEL